VSHVEVLWHSSELASSEHCSISLAADGLAVGASTTITAAWVRFPEFDVVASEQTYTRLADDRWRYASGRFEAELEVDPATNVVRRYGEDLWRAAVYTVT